LTNAVQRILTHTTHTNTHTHTHTRTHTHTHAHTHTNPHTHTNTHTHTHNSVKARKGHKSGRQTNKTGARKLPRSCACSAEQPFPWIHSTHTQTRLSTLTPASIFTAPPPPARAPITIPPTPTNTRSYIQTHTHSHTNTHTHLHTLVEGRLGRGQQDPLGPSTLTLLQGLLLLLGTQQTFSLGQALHLLRE